MSAIFADGESSSLALAEISDSYQQFTLKTHGFAFLRGVQRLNDWIRLHFADTETMDDDARQQLCEIVADLIRQREAEEGSASKLRPDARWTVGNVILRRRGAENYTRTIHRDLDEVATHNLRLHERLAHYYNAWIPLVPLHSDPLALLLPGPHQAASFLGYSEADRTGLVRADDQRWVYLAGMVPGDLILWYSERVFHVSCPLPEQTAHTRVSLDVRIYFEE